MKDHESELRANIKKAKGATEKAARELALQVWVCCQMDSTYDPYNDICKAIVAMPANASDVLRCNQDFGT